MTRTLLIVAALFMAAGACGSVTVGPFVPPHAKPCSWEGDCEPGTTCRFPSAGSRAVCMPGDNRLDVQPALPR